MNPDSSIGCWPAAIWLILAIAMTMASPAAAQTEEPENRTHVLGTAGTSGIYHPVGVALSTLIKLKLLPRFNADLTAINTAGSTENAALLRQKEVQFGILSAQAGYDAGAGEGLFAEAGPDPSLRAVTTLWLNVSHAVIRSEQARQGDIGDFIDLEGATMALGRQDSGTLLENSALMQGLGVDIDRRFDLASLGYRESAEAFIKGRIDGMILSAGLPIGAIEDTFAAMGDQARLLEISDQQLAAIDRGRRIWTRMVIPAGTYPGQNRDVATIGTPHILAVRSDVDDEVVYEITKTIFDEIEYLHSLHPATTQISLDTALRSLPLPVHPGAARYFEEKGVALPPEPLELANDLLPRFDSVEQARAAVNQGTIWLMTGTSGETSARIAAELAAVLEDDVESIRLISTSSRGSGQNLADLLYLKGADAAFVQADVLEYARQMETYPAITSQVNYITEMYPEELHLLVQSEIGDIRELKGKKINIGPRGAGSEITASIVMTNLGLPFEPRHDLPHVALAKLKSGEIDAAFFVSGKPMPIIEELSGEDGLRLLNVPLVPYAEAYEAAAFNAKDYPDLVPQGEEVSTLAVRTLLIAYGWNDEAPRYVPLAGFTRMFFDRLGRLRSDGRHPKWQDVDPAATLGGWRRFVPAEQWLDANAAKVERLTLERTARQATALTAAKTPPANDRGRQDAAQAAQPAGVGPAGGPGPDYTEQQPRQQWPRRSSRVSDAGVPAQSTRKTVPTF